MPSNPSSSEDKRNRAGARKGSGSRREDRGAGIFGRLKPKKKQRRTDAYGGAVGKAWSLDDLADEMQRLGLEPRGLGNFIASLHKLAVASGVNPSVLATVIRDLSSLSEDEHVPIEQVRKKIQRLAEEQKVLAIKVKELSDKKASIESEIDAVGNEQAHDKESLSKFIQLQQQLEEVGVSIEDFSRLALMVASAKQIGFCPSAVTEILSNIDAAQQMKNKAENDLERLLDTKNAAQQRALALEQEIADKQKIIDSVNNASSLGLGPEDLDQLSSAIKMIAKTRNIDEASAKRRLTSDLESYYANDQELRSRLRTLEALVREKEEKFNMLDADLHNEKAVLDSATKLISAGLDEKWLAKLRSIIDTYGLDIDSLAKELQTRSGLSASIEELVRTKKTLEEEEKLLRQKVVAAEDQRIKTLTMINDIIVHAPRSVQAQTRQAEATKLSAAQVAESPEFLTSAQKAIEVIRAKLPVDSPARLVLEHALLALRLESTRG